MTPEELYLDLLKKTLTFSLWPEPPVPIESYNFRRSPLKKWIVNALVRVLKTRQLGLVENHFFDQEMRTIGKGRPGYADSMIGMKRLDNIEQSVFQVIKDGVPGDLIETGVWRGGACIFMRAMLKVYGVADRKVFVADSFAGLPRPDAQKYPADAGDEHYKQFDLNVSRNEVERNFKRYGMLDEQVVFLEGWFKDTLPKAPIEKLAVLRLDGDMYSSTVEAFDALYPKLSAGGYCIVDDYSLPGCKAAIDDLRIKYKITEPIVRVDWTGVYWRKTGTQ